MARNRLRRAPAPTTPCSWAPPAVSAAFDSAIDRPMLLAGPGGSRASWVAPLPPRHRAHHDHRRDRTGRPGVLHLRRRYPGHLRPRRRPMDALGGRTIPHGPGMFCGDARQIAALRRRLSTTYQHEFRNRLQTMRAVSEMARGHGVAPAARTSGRRWTRASGRSPRCSANTLRIRHRPPPRSSCCWRSRRRKVIISTPALHRPPRAPSGRAPVPMTRRGAGEGVEAARAGDAGNTGPEQAPR